VSSRTSTASDPSPGQLKLAVLLLTADPRLARRVGVVCRHRENDFLAVGQTRELRLALAQRTPDVLLLDATASVEKAARLAAAIALVHPSLGIALATVGHDGRSARGFRLIDVRRPREQVADELELTYIRIPASVHDAQP
jgi:hypothetical protein